MAQHRVLELVVGLFFCIGVAAIFILTLRVSSINSFSGGQSYTVTASFNNIGQLKTGAPVKMDGVQVGTVTGIHLDQKTFEAIVTMSIKDQYDQIPRRGTSASIFTAGLLGQQYVGLEPGFSDASLQDGDRIQITQSALILEKIIGQVLLNKVEDSGSH